MAKRDDTSKARPVRGRTSSGAAKTPDSGSDAGANEIPDLLDYIEEERARLMKAADSLDCVLVAMDEDEGGSPEGPYYPSVIETARDLVNESINQLDSIRLRPMVEALQRDSGLGGYSVKECPRPEYTLSAPKTRQ